MALRASDYLVVPRIAGSPRARLVCFPHAGGGPSAYTSWQSYFDNHQIEVVSICLPGREHRFNEPLLTDGKEIVREISAALQDSGLVDDVPYAFFGHSLGGLLAVEVAKQLDYCMVGGRPRPIHLFVSGTGPIWPINDFAYTENIHSLDDSGMVQLVNSFGFLPAGMLDDNALSAAVLPTLRADFQVYETFSPEANQALLAVPVTSLGGKADHTVPVSRLTLWAEETSHGVCGPEMFQGGHFYLDEQRAEVLHVIHRQFDASFNSLPKSVEKSTMALPGQCTTRVMHDIIREVAGKYPNQEAVVEEGNTLTFGELVRRADLIASKLQREFLLGKKHGVIALLMPHDLDYVTCMLAVWEAGAAILLLETHFPAHFCQEVCQESRADVGVTNEFFVSKLEGGGCQTLTLGTEWVAILEQQHASVEFSRVGPEDLCLLSMTSGTTGRPKTIAGQHSFLHSGTLAREERWPLTKDDNREAFNVMFVWEVLRPLLFGYTSIIIPDSAMVDPQRFVSFMHKWKCTRVLTTPSLLSSILQYCADDMKDKLKLMRVWWMCGEVLPMTTVRPFSHILPACKLVNSYSCWECGDIGIAEVCPRASYEPSQVFACAGDIAAGTVAAVVDPDTMQVVPRGVCGEIYAGGSFMSRGYYQRADLTNERMIEAWTPELKQVWSGKWYKTGDLGRFVGEPPVLELRGRMDFTVKIRGYKVGIPVVETAISECSGVARCAVVPVLESPAVVDSLLCFIGVEDGLAFDDVVQSVKLESFKKIPRWMMPTYFRPIPSDAVSDGDSRKLNRRYLASLADLQALRESQIAQNEKANDADAVSIGSDPQDSAEDLRGVRSIVRAVWAKSLNLNPSSLDLEENFFNIGGHSALAARIAAELSSDYGLAVSALDIYSNSTLGALLDFVDNAGSKTSLGAVSVEGRGRLPRGTAGGVQSIAVCGLEGRFPGADSAEEFWENLRKGAVSATFLPKETLRQKGLGADVVDHKDYVPVAYMVNDADKFDHQFFGIGRHEASLMDPQHRLFIEVCWAALENGSLSPKDALSKTVVGVYASCGIDGYMIHHLDGAPLKAATEPNDVLFGEIGNEKEYIATRVSYLMDFTGPSMNVNSACSSALVAGVQAAASITFGQCDAAITGASSVTFPNLGYLYQDGLVASPDGFVRPFDSKAEGTVFGDSVIAMVLRRVEDAGDGLVLGQMRGFSVSNDGGQKAGYAAPSSSGQSLAITSAMHMMGEDPWSISYVECHATGTRIGDGIETRGLMNAFTQVGGSRGSKEVSVALGSVKGNIAHANCAAGGTGLVKTLMMLQSQAMVPTANFSTLNPKVNLDGTSFFVNSELCAWNTDGKPKRAGVSSFGIGGTNAHVILEAAVQPDQNSTEKEGSQTATRLPFQVLPFSAKTPSALHRTAMHVADRMKQCPVADGDVARAAFTLQNGRSALPVRKAVVVPSAGGLESDVSFVDTLQKEFPDLDELEEMEEAVKKPTVAFLFPGQGSQYFPMACGMYDHVPLFRAEVDRCCELFLAPEMLGFDLRPLLFATPSDVEKGGMIYSRPTVLQPSMFVVEYSLARVLLAIGVTPVAVAGHSLGEYAAAVIGGVITLESAVQVVATRSKATEALEGKGAMISVVDWSEEELSAVSKGDRQGLWLAGVNSPKHAVISGETQAVDALEKELIAAGRKCTKLHVHQAFHSGLVSQAADTLHNIGMPREKKQKDDTTTIPVASNLTGGWLNASRLEDGTYWSKHMRGTVLWRQNAEKIISQWKPTAFVEVGPGNALCTLTSKCVDKSSSAPMFFQAMRPRQDPLKHDVEAFLEMIAKLWEVGCFIDWQALHSKVVGVEHAPIPLQLPSHRFDQTSLWVNPERSVYVDEVTDPAPEAYAFKTTSSVEQVSKVSKHTLVRFNDQPSGDVAIRAYCLPFASGSSTVFAPWCKSLDEAVEVVCVELPGRGGRSEEKCSSSDADDGMMIDDICSAILADLRGAQYVLVGFSMGGNLSVEISLQMAERNAQMPLALYVAGRRPPHAEPGSILDFAMSNEELAEYAFAPPEVASTPEFTENVVPLLRADLELDTRTERRISKAILSGRTFPQGIGLEVYCGTNDSVAPWSEAEGWQKIVQEPMGLHYFPGGHEFMKEHRPAILKSWRRDCVGRLLQRRSQEMTVLAARGFAVPGAIPTQSVKAVAQGSTKDTSKDLPLHAVRWVAATADCKGESTAVVHLVDLGAELGTMQMQQAESAVRKGEVLMVACAPRSGVLTGDNVLEAEVSQAFQFMRVVQHLTEAGLSGRIVVLCPAAASGAMVSGASKSVALEARELQIQRCFVSQAMLSDAHQQSAAILALVNRYSEESDIWIQGDSGRDQVCVPRLEPMVPPSAKLPCVQKCSNGKPAVYVLTGATGGLGKAVVNWLIHSEGILPEQLVLLRRPGSSVSLSGDMAKCRVVEVADLHDTSKLLSSSLRDLQNVVGIFHLAGALDDGVLQHMTQKRFESVAKPKCGILLALMHAATEFQWSLKWTLGFSSTSSLFGFSGQSNYCAANAMLDNMAIFGSGELPCRLISVNWGPWGELGMAKKGTKAYEMALEEGETPLSTATALNCLAAALRIAGQAQPLAVQLCASDVSWGKTQWNDLAMLDLVHTRSANKKSAAGAQGAAVPRDAGVSSDRAVEHFLLKHLKSGGNWKRVVGKSLFDLGLDSLETVQLRNAFNKQFGVNVPLSLLADPSQKLMALEKALRQYVKV